MQDYVMMLDGAAALNYYQDTRLEGSTYLLIISGMSWICPYALCFIFCGYKPVLPA